MLPVLEQLAMADTASEAAFKAAVDGADPVSTAAVAFVMAEAEGISPKQRKPATIMAYYA